MKFRAIRMSFPATVGYQDELDPDSIGGTDVAEKSFARARSVAAGPRTEVTDEEDLGANVGLCLLDPETLQAETLQAETLRTETILPESRKPQAPRRKNVKAGQQVRTATAKLAPRGRRDVGTLPICPKCCEGRLNISTVKGPIEEVLFILGSSFYRCYRCEVRFAKVAGRMIHLKETQGIEKEHIVFAAITVGALLCLGVALYVQRLAHRWPF